MSAQTVTLLHKEFVLLPKREYDRLVARVEEQARQDRGDVAEARRRSKERSIPLSEARKRLGF